MMSVAWLQTVAPPRRQFHIPEQDANPIEQGVEFRGWNPCSGINKG